jgi:HK97 family phage prohead protease
MAKTEGLETRFIKASELTAEARLDPGEGPKLAGYAALFNKTTEIMPGFKERIARGAFARALSEKQDVRALVDHQSEKIIGRTAAGTLDLSENNKGLKTVIRPPDTQVGRDIVTSVGRGDVDGMSFAFRAVKESWEDHKDGTSTRTVEDVDLFDVSVVTYPAYPDTSVAVRSFEKRKASIALDANITAQQANNNLQAWRDGTHKLDPKIKAADCPRLARCKRILAETLDPTTKTG